MVDVQRLKDAHDLRLIIEQALGPSNLRGGAACLWRCPFHQERHDYSLAVWIDGWRCFGACQIHGDLLDWLRRYRGLTFEEACEYLGAEQPSDRIIRRCNRSVPNRIVPEAQPPGNDWQDAMKWIVDTAEGALRSLGGERTRQYLKKRGLTDETILRARLGYIPGRPWEWITLGKFSVPCSPLYPLVRWTGVMGGQGASCGRFTQIYPGRRGNAQQGLYNAASLEGHKAILFVEGEFDALLAEQECAGLVGVATLGSASGMLNSHWLSLWLHCSLILVAYDTDEAGRKGEARLEAITARADTVKLPYGKDLTEFFYGEATFLDDYLIDIYRRFSGFYSDSSSLNSYMISAIDNSTLCC